MLKATDTVPTADQIRSVSGEPESDLLAVALDDSLGAYVRRRATTLISLFANDTGEAYLMVIAGFANHPRVRWAAVYTYCRGWAVSARDRVLSFAASTLDDASPLIREATVRGLRWVEGPEAGRLLDARLERETDDMVRAAIRHVKARRTTAR